MRTITVDFTRALRAVRTVRIVTLLLAAVGAGLLSDFLRGEQRLVFPRPLPTFRISSPAP